MAKKSSSIQGNRMGKGRPKSSAVRRSGPARSQFLPGTFVGFAKREQPEETLELFRTLLNQADDSIEIIDPATGRFLDSNEKAFSSLGYTREEHRSLTVPDIDPIVTAPVFARYIAQLRASGSLTL